MFCTTAMVTALVADLLGELHLNVREIHSRKSQSYRTKVSEEFRKSKGLILATSDVSARGVDYPDVTLVIQVVVCPLKSTSACQSHFFSFSTENTKGMQLPGGILMG